MNQKCKNKRDQILKDQFAGNSSSIQNPKKDSNNSKNTFTEKPGQRIQGLQEKKSIEF